MADPYTKFEVSRFTCYEAMNDHAKCRKWGGLRWLWGTQGYGQCHYSIERMRRPVQLLTDTMCPSCTVIEILLAISRKSLILIHPTCILRPRKGRPRSNSRKFLHQKNRVPGLSCGVVWVILRLVVLVEYRLLTDGQTDRHMAMACTMDA